MRNFKALALALVAVFALSAMAASAAQANHFTTSNNGVDEAATLDGSSIGNQVFATPEGESICTAVSLDETTVPGGTATEITAHPTYTSCTAFGQSATVTFNGCDYKFHEPTYIGTDEEAGQPVTHTHTGTVDLHCPEGKVVEIHVYLSSADTTTVCTITVKPTTTTATNGTESRDYTFGGHVVYSSTTLTPGSPNDIDLNATITGIHFEEHGALCPDGNTVAGNNATYSGKVTIKATNAEGQTIDAQVTGEEKFEV